MAKYDPVTGEYVPVVTVGADPELFLVNEKDEVVSAIPYFRQYKGQGEAVAAGMGAVIHDNVAVEFSMTPAKSSDEWVNIIEEIKAALNRELARRAEGKGLRLVTNFASAIVAKDQLKHRHARTFGCEPDFNAWTGGSVNVPPDSREVGQLRVIGGHIHVGTGDRADVNEILTSHWGRIAVVRLLDATVGQYVLDLEAKSPNAESFVRRRTMYGRAGAFRAKPYGLEYRTPSAIWIESPEAEENVFHAVNKAVHLIADLDTVAGLEKFEGHSNALGLLLDRAGINPDQLQESINTGKPVPTLVTGAIA